MNVNITQVSDSSKATSTTSQSAEIEQSEGFFAKLAAFIKGESSEKQSVDGVTVDSPVEGDESTKLLLEQEVSLDGDVGNEDAPLLVKNNVPDSEKHIDADSLKDQSQVLAEGAAQKSGPAIPSNLLESDAEKIVSENGELLGRLDDANKALKDQSGKELPLKGNDNHIPVSDDLNIQHNQTTLRQAVGKEVATTNLSSGIDSIESASLAQAISQEQYADIPEIAKQFIESEQMPSDAVLPTELMAHKLSSVNKADELDALDVDQVKLAIEGDIERLKHQLKEQGLSGNEIEQIVESAKAQAMSEQLQPHITPVAKAVHTELRSSDLNPHSTNIAESAHVQANPIEAVEAIPAMATSAIPWSASPEEVVGNEILQKLDGKHKSAQTPVVQSTPQMLNQASQSSNLANSQHIIAPTPNVPFANDVSINQLQQVAATPVASEQAVLKAALGAKTLGALGKLSQSGAKQGAASGQEFGLAQQLSQAAGQQVGAGQTQLRAEQASAQAPLPLNRELAGDQVAERVQMMMSKNLKNVDIRLDPPELGRLQIRLNVGGDGATVHFTVANQQARDVIEQSMPRLREMLAQQGVQLGDSSVQQQSSGQQNRYAGNNSGNGQSDSNQAFSNEENLEPGVNLDLNVTTKRDGISYYA
ncbi:flagellar hook-length control protein FliK [Vibrio sp. OCN044]|uniref:Flagellar hook-length control protein FliK n=1 Tax=Vibrio tetraodonis subsp. pristinus TaxID=2695891 RepID=A0A6L8LVG4_9VIBR|nr:flagellar hook-length control protein FliK [Vibrio tetraodonis]MYM59775.1 flagellar hook-length control protein FliK [Vibrio tetraodonis subsp. pristinus]